MTWDPQHFIKDKHSGIECTNSDSASQWRNGIVVLIASDFGWERKSCFHIRKTCKWWVDCICFYFLGLLRLTVDFFELSAFLSHYLWHSFLLVHVTSHWRAVKQLCSICVDVYRTEENLRLIDPRGTRVKKWQCCMQFAVSSLDFAWHETKLKAWSAPMKCTLSAPARTKIYGENADWSVKARIQGSTTQKSVARPQSQHLCFSNRAEMQPKMRQRIWRWFKNNRVLSTLRTLVSCYFFGPKGQFNIDSRAALQWQSDWLHPHWHVGAIRCNVVNNWCSIDFSSSALATINSSFMHDITAVFS